MKELIAKYIEEIRAAKIDGIEDKAAAVEQFSKEDVDAFLRGDRVLSCTERNDH